MQRQQGLAGPRSSATRAWGYADDERAYTEWVHCFVDRLRLRLPDVPAHHVHAAADRWAHHCDRLSPEDAAEIAAMWWNGEHDGLHG